MDRFFKTCLVLIVLLLAVIALRLIMFPQSVHAQANKYVAVKAYGGSPGPGLNGIQAVLDKYAADGWELAAPSLCRKVRHREQRRAVSDLPQMNNKL